VTAAEVAVVQWWWRQQRGLSCWCWRRESTFFCCIFFDDHKPAFENKRTRIAKALLDFFVTDAYSVESQNGSFPCVGKVQRENN
jgi:hypothetical protein